MKRTLQLNLIFSLLWRWPVMVILLITMGCADQRGFRAYKPTAQDIARGAEIERLKNQGGDRDNGPTNNGYDNYQQGNGSGGGSAAVPPGLPQAGDITTEGDSQGVQAEFKNFMDRLGQDLDSSRTRQILRGITLTRSDQGSESGALNFAFEMLVSPPQQKEGGQENFISLHSEFRPLVLVSKEGSPTPTMLGRYDASVFSYKDGNSGDSLSSSSAQTEAFLRCRTKGSESCEEIDVFLLISFNFNGSYQNNKMGLQAICQQDKGSRSYTCQPVSRGETGGIKKIGDPLLSFKGAQDKIAKEAKNRAQSPATGVGQENTAVVTQQPATVDVAAPAVDGAASSGDGDQHKINDEGKQVTPAIPQQQTRRPLVVIEKDELKQYVGGMSLQELKEYKRELLQAQSKEQTNQEKQRAIEDKIKEVDQQIQQKESHWWEFLFPIYG